MLVTLLCVWVGYHLNWIRERNAAFEQWEEHAHFVCFICDPVSGDRRRPAPLSLRLFGQDGFIEIEVFRSFATEQILSKLGRLFPEADVKVIDDPTSPNASEHRDVTDISLTPASP